MIIGTYATTLLYALTNVIKSKVDKDEDKKDLNYTIISHMIQIRNAYFKNNKKNLLDDTIFKDFSAECIGHIETLEKERQLLRKSRKSKGKPLVWRFDPTSQNKITSGYKFPNTSGNPISYPNNLKLSGEIKIEDEYEEENNESTDTQI